MPLRGQRRVVPLRGGTRCCQDGEQAVGRAHPPKLCQRKVEAQQVRAPLVRLRARRAARRLQVREAGRGSV